MPPDAVLDSERRKRFEQEAQAVSALNHPNILVVHDIGEENSVHYLVSELVEGESLRKLLQRGAIPIKKLLEISVQIADGLEPAKPGKRDVPYRSLMKIFLAERLAQEK